VAAAVTGAAYPWLLGTLLSAILIFVLWANTCEMKQRGLSSQLWMSVMSVVATGYILRMR
jgi:hypothetical protein